MTTPVYFFVSDLFVSSGSDRGMTSSQINYSSTDFPQGKYIQSQNSHSDQTPKSPKSFFRLIKGSGLYLLSPLIKSYWKGSPVVNRFVSRGYKGVEVWHVLSVVLTTPTYSPTTRPVDVCSRF